MGNWFKENPSPSIIIYTITIGATVWAAFHFIFDENKIKLHEAQVENYKSQVQTYKAKVEILETVNFELKSENKKLNEWLVETPKSIPYLERQIERLETENTQLLKKISSLEEPSSILVTIEEPAALYYFEQTLSKGEAFIDKATSASISFNNFRPDFTASAYVEIPNEKSATIPEIKPGKKWVYRTGDKNYMLSVHELNFYTNEAKISIEEIKNP